MAKRSLIKLENSHKINNNVVRNLLSEKFCSPYTVIELSSIQWDMLGKNSFDFKGLIKNRSIKKHLTISYSNTTYGANIHLKRRCCESNGKRLHWKSTQLNSIKGGVF